MENGNQTMAKKSLMNSLENLNSKVYAIEELSNLSYRLLKKFTNPRPELEPAVRVEEMSKNLADKKTPDLIDLFDGVAETMEQSINSIGQNLEQLLNMIE